MARRYYFSASSRPPSRHSVDLRELGARIAGWGFALALLAICVWALTQKSIVG